MEVDYEEDYYNDDDCYLYYDEDDNDDEDENENENESLFPKIKIYSLVLTTDDWYILASEHLLIADIDCGHNVELELNRLQDFVARYGGCFKVYKLADGHK